MVERVKNSIVGDIPKDWIIIKLGDIGIFKKGKNIPRSELKTEGLPCVIYGDIYTKYNIYSDKLISKISIETASSSVVIKFGDILFAGSGETAEEIGKCFTYIGIEKAYAGGDVIIFTSENIDPVLLGFILNSDKINKQKSSMGQGSSVFHIYPSNLKNIAIALPTEKTEQENISQTLKDTVELISKLEKLIAKKRAIKQGAMQELLKPKEGWKNNKLGKLAVSYSGGTPLTSNLNYYNGGIPWVVIADITKAGKYIFSTEKTISEEGLNSSSAKLFNKGTLLFAMYASIGKCTIATIDITCNQAILGIQAKFINTEYLYYYLSFFERKFLQMGQTGTQSNLNKEIVEDIDIFYPNSAEQLDIVKVLSDMDSEIESLVKKLEKYRLLKQGMMQNLLTGKIRLV